VNNKAKNPKDVAKWTKEYEERVNLGADAPSEFRPLQSSVEEEKKEEL